MNMMIICFKNGKELKVPCEETEVEQNVLLGKLTEINFKGLKDIKPMYIDLNEVLYVCFVREQESEEQNGKNINNNL